METIYQIKYILPPGESQPEKSDEEFLRQLSIQNQNAPRIAERLRYPVRDLGDCLRQTFPRPGTLVLWQKQSILWGTWDGNACRFPEEEEPDVADILELRLFSEEEELHLLNRRGILDGRFARDDGCGWRLCTDTVSPLWGENVGECAPGFLRLKDAGRRLEMKIPFRGKHSERFGLRTRNYIGEIGDMGQLGYTDCRFLSVEPIE